MLYLSSENYFSIGFPQLNVLPIQCQSVHGVMCCCCTRQLVLERKLCGSVFDVQFPFCEIEIHERKCAPKIVSVLQSLIRVLIISVNKFQHVSKNSCCLSRWFVMLLRILVSVANFKIARIEICGNTERIIQKRIDCLSSCWHH